MDGSIYLLTGADILDGGEWTRWFPDHRGPLFPAVLALAFRLGEISIQTAGLVVKASILLCVLVVYGIGRRLQGPLAGLLAVAILTASPYYLYFVRDIKLDGLSAGLMLFALALFLAARDKQNHKQERSKKALLALSGIALGLAFLTKETALLWLPLPLIVVLSSIQLPWRRKLEQITAFYGGFGLAVAWWFLYYYRQTGAVFLLSIHANQLLQPLMLASAVCAILVGCVVLAHRLLRPGQQLHLQQGLSNLLRSLSEKGWTAGLVIFLAYALIMTLALAPRGQPIVSWQDVLGRFAAIPYFFQRQAFPTQPLLPAVIITWPVVLALSYRRKHYYVLVLSALLYLPLVYLVSSPSHGRWWTARQLMGLYLVSYVTLGLVGAEIIHFLSIKFGSLMQRKGQKQAIVSLAAACVVIVAVLASIGQSATHAWNYDRDPFEGTWFGYEVQDTAAWLQENVPPGTPIMVSRASSYSLQFLTESQQYHYVHVPMSYRSTLEQSEAGWYLGSFANHQIAVSNPLYVRDYSADPPRFFAISLQDLLKEIESHQIEYLVVRSEDVRYAFQEEIRFFRDSPVFEQVYHRTSKTGQALHAYRVRRAYSGAMSLDYPVTLHRKSFDLWRQRAATGAAFYTEYELYRAVGQHGILVEGNSPQLFEAYVHIGNVFRQHHDWRLAAFEYRLALEADPSKADQILALAQDLGLSRPDDGAIWVLLGDAYRALDQDALAQDAYSQALELPNLASETQSAALRGLGHLHFALGDYRRSIQELEQSIQLNTFGSTDSRQTLLIARGHLFQANGQIDEAIRAYRQALSSSYGKNSMQVSPEPLEPRAIDFVRQFDRAEIHAASEDVVHPAVFIIEGVPQPVLFAHPPAEVSYRFEVPAKGILRFAPVIAPEVLQLGTSDGIQFDISVDNGRSNYSIFSEYIDPRNHFTERLWHDREIDLAPWNGQTITITFATGPGPHADDRYDWAGWGDPRIVQPVAYDFSAHLSEAETVNLRLGQTQIVTQTIGAETRTVLFQHPTSSISYSLSLPAQSTLSFGLGLDPAVWSPDKGDGVAYNVYVRNSDNSGAPHRVFHRYIDAKNDMADRRWFDERVDLGRFGGQAVDIIFEALPGPAGDGNYDWGGWSTPVLIDETLPENLLGSGTNTLWNPP